MTESDSQKHPNQLYEYPKSPAVRFISDVEIYNRLMLEYAKKGDTNSIRLLTNHMCTKEIFKLKLNLNSYVVALQSLGYNLLEKEVKKNETNSSNENDYEKQNDKNDEKKELNKIRLQAQRILIDIHRAKVSKAE
jgi:hypothetical protein